MAVVVVEELTEHRFKVMAAEDEYPVEALASDGADERSANALARGARTWVRMIRAPSARKTSSKLDENLASRSRMRNLTGCARTASWKVRFLAC
jgi:hypothetical protein